MTSESITVDQFIARPPARVWEAITTPELLAAWWVPGNIEPTVGHEFLLEMPGWARSPASCSTSMSPAGCRTALATGP